MSKYYYSKNKKCPDCGKGISDKAIRCKSCAGIISYSEGRNRKMQAARRKWISKNKMKVASNFGKYLKATGSQTGAWKGGKFTRCDGYVAIRTKVKTYKLEHRLVMEEHLGRELKSFEKVHHIDEDRGNNDINNLILVTGSKHQIIHANAYNYLIKIGKVREYLKEGGFIS